MIERLPSSWVSARIDDVADVNPPGATVMTSDDALVSFLPMAAVTELSGVIDLSMHRPFGEVKKGFTRFKDGDVLLAKITPSMENGKITVARGLTGGIGCGTTEFHVIRPAAGVEADYLRYFLLRSAFRQEARRNMQGAVGQQRVPADFVRDTHLPVAPESEQQRIVSKIDELFSDIEEGERALERVQKLLERYRQSVLKAAVSGELTHAWREQHKGKRESGAALLARILKARREAWEKAELDRMKAKARKPADDKWKQKYEEPSPPVATDLPELPGGWVWASIAQLCDLENGDRSKNYPSRAHYVESGVPFISAGNIVDGRLDMDRLNFISEGRFAMLRAGHIQPGDLLFCLRGSLGKVALNGLSRGAIASSLVILRPGFPALTHYLMLYFQGPLAAQQVGLYDNGTAQPNLAAADLARFAVPLPPLVELATIEELTAALLASANKYMNDISLSANMSSSLRQRILKSAFSGNLLPQEPSDESAAALLERIAAERRANLALKRARGKEAIA